MGSLNWVTIGVLTLFVCTIQITQSQLSRSGRLRLDEDQDKILRILMDAHQSIEDEILRGVTRLTNLKEYHEIIPILDKLRLTILRLKGQLVSIRTPQDLYGKLNATEVLENLRALDYQLNPNENKKFGSILLTWKNQLDSLKTEIGWGDLNSESSTASNWIESISKFSKFVGEEAYWVAERFNEQITNLTDVIGQDYLESVKKPEVLVPKRRSFTNTNVTLEVIVEREEEMDDLTLKIAREKLVRRLNILSKLLEDVDRETSVRGFVRRFLGHKEQFPGSRGSREAVEKLSLVLAARSRGEIDLAENYGRVESPYKERDWVRGFWMAQKFLKDKIEAIDQRESDRRQWKATREYQKVDQERERLDKLRVRIGSYGYVCKGDCVEHKDYYWCESDSKWDFCSPREGRDYKNKLCKDKCDYHGAKYKWCNVEGDTWGYCSTFRT